MLARRECQARGGLGWGRSISTPFPVKSSNLRWRPAFSRLYSRVQRMNKNTRKQTAVNNPPYSNFTSNKTIYSYFFYKIRLIRFLIIFCRLFSSFKLIFSFVMLLAPCLNCWSSKLENPERELSPFPFKVSLQIRRSVKKKGGGNEILASLLVNNFKTVIRALIIPCLWLPFWTEPVYINTQVSHWKVCDGGSPHEDNHSKPNKSPDYNYTMAGYDELVKYSNDR